MGDAVGVVPMPLGPDNAERVIPGNVDAYGVSATSDNPDGALLYLIGCAEYEEMLKAEQEAKNDGFAPPLSLMTKENAMMIEEYLESEAATKVRINGYEGVSNMRKKTSPWWKDIFAGTPIATANETFRPVFQAEIDVVLDKREE